jgi:hypothetical protein
MIFNTHYYTQGSFVIRSTENGEKSSIWIEAPTEVINFTNIFLTKVNPIECLADVNRTSLNKSISHRTENLHGVLRYHSLNGDFFAHLVFAMPTDLFVWDIHYKAFLIAVPLPIRNLLNQSEAHALDKAMESK